MKNIAFLIFSVLIFNVQIIDVVQGDGPPGPVDPKVPPPAFDPSKLGLELSKLVPAGIDPKLLPPGFDLSKLSGFDPSKLISAGQGADNNPIQGLFGSITTLTNDFTRVGAQLMGFPTLIFGIAQPPSALAAKPASLN